MTFKKQKKEVKEKNDGLPKKSGKEVVQIRKCLENGQFTDSVTKYIDLNTGKKIREILEEKIR